MAFYNVCLYITSFLSQICKRLLCPVLFLYQNGSGRNFQISVKTQLFFCLELFHNCCVHVRSRVESE